MKSKKHLVLIILIISVLALVGCNGNKEKNITSTDDKVVITFSHNQPTTSPEHAGAEKFKEVAEELGNGKVEVNLFPAQQMGSLREQVEATQIGTINISMQPSAVISPFVDDIKICDLPYLWPSDKESTYEILDGPMGEELLTRLGQGGFKGLGYWFGGYKLITTKDTEIHRPEDFKGLKIRVMEAPILISQYKAWGANPIALAYSELYNGLQQGIVDGQENPLQTIYLNNYHEVQNEIIESYHGVMMYVMIANQKWFDSLPENIQDIIIEAEKAGRIEARKVLEETEAEYVENIKNSGANYYELTEDEIEEFRKISRPVHEEHYNEEWQKDYINRLYDEIDKVVENNN